MSDNKQQTNMNMQAWFEMLVATKIPDVPMGRNKVFKILREKKYLMEGNIPYQRFVDEGYFKMELRPRLDKNNEVAQWYAITLASPKGIELIKKLVKEQEAGNEQDNKQ